MIFINRWYEILKYRKFNILDFELFEISVEVDRFVGDMDIRFIVLGLGFVVSFVYSRQRYKKFMKELERRLEMDLDNGGEE